MPPLRLISLSGGDEPYRLLSICVKHDKDPSFSSRAEGHKALLSFGVVVFVSQGIWIQERIFRLIKCYLSVLLRICGSFVRVSDDLYHIHHSSRPIEAACIRTTSSGREESSFA
jgi:hypothetical protein